MNDERNVSWTGTHPLEALYDAALVRAKAAEVERDEANLKSLQAEYRVIQLEARVAELEAAVALSDKIRADSRLIFDLLTERVAELEAAQQWRPVTEEWPPYLERVVIGQRGGTWAAFARRVRIGAAGDEVWLLDSETTLDFESANVVFSLPPIPPAPEADAS